MSCQETQHGILTYYAVSRIWTCAGNTHWISSPTPYPLGQKWGKRVCPAGGKGKKRGERGGEREKEKEEKRRRTYTIYFFYLLSYLLNNVYTQFCTHCKVYHHFNFHVSCGNRTDAVAISLASPLALSSRSAFRKYTCNAIWVAQSFLTHKLNFPYKSPKS